MTDVVITSAARAAIGAYGRSLRDVPPAELGVTVARAAIERAGLEPGQVQQVVFGNVIHTAPGEIRMGVTAENVADSHGISRDAQDEFALEFAPPRPGGHRGGPVRRGGRTDRGQSARRHCRVQSW